MYPCLLDADILNHIEYGAGEKSSIKSVPVCQHFNVLITDHVFGMDSTTLDVYKATTRDIVASAVKGINGKCSLCSVFVIQK
jgi:hypothetical protein